MLTVVIPTRNRAELLRSALCSLETQTLPADRFEVLVVDNGSTDDTPAVVESFRERLGNLRYLFEPTPGLHAGRHRGLKEARGEVLVFADDDIEATPTWLEAVEDCFRDPYVALVGGNNYPKFEAPPPEWLQRLWDRPSLGGHAIGALSVLELPPGRRALDPRYVWGCNFSIHRSVLLEAGGFHPDAMPEALIRFRGDGESHVSRYIRDRGLTCLFDSRAGVHHAVTRERMTLEYFRKRAFNQGVSDSYTHLRNGEQRPAPAGPIAALKAVARKLRAAVKARLPHDRALRELERITREGHREGYAFHQAAYRDDPEVRAWVHRADYF